ncbi:hypothetical protein [Streptomyces californicus]|uniref:hypothetical protein n=1 Tax=Streptomyces californicus TaxID=67351 RepID=UPI0004BEA045|nr:hypothetical protein [Streptomyces californicus]
MAASAAAPVLIGSLPVSASIRLDRAAVRYEADQTRDGRATMTMTQVLSDGGARRPLRGLSGPARPSTYMCAHRGEQADSGPAPTGAARAASRLLHR